jgi:tetratricopeptide (TPR) repeat protein
VTVKVFSSFLGVLLTAVPALAQDPPPTPPTPSEQATPPASPAPAAPAEAPPPALADARARFREGNFQAALDAALAALQAQPGNTVAHYIAGTSFVRLGRLDEAGPHLKTVQETAPTMPGLHFQLGFLAYRRAEDIEKLQKYDEARALYLEAAKEFAIELEKAPDQVASLSSRAAALFHAGETEEAIKAHEAWIAAAPTTNDPYISLAAVYANDSRTDDALAQFDRLPNNDRKTVTDSLLGLAQSLYAHGQFGDAIAIAARAVELDPTSTRGLSLLTAASANKGMVEETAQSFSRYLGLNPAPEELEEVADAITQRFGEQSGNPPVVAPGTTLPVIVRAVRPRYPTAAGRSKIETKVLLFAQVKADATLGDVIVVPSRLGKDLKDLGFADAAIDTARKTKFKAGTKNGQPADMYLPMTIPFIP